MNTKIIPNALGVLLDARLELSEDEWPLAFAFFATASPAPRFSR